MEMDNFSDNTLNKIKELCDIRGWSVYRLAKEADIPYSSLNNIFIRNTHPTIPTLEKICNGFNITLEEFFHPEVPVDFKYRYSTLTDDESKLLETYRSMSADEQKILLTYAYGIAKKLPAR